VAVVPFIFLLSLFHESPSTTGFTVFLELCFFRIFRYPENLYLDAGSRAKEMLTVMLEIFHWSKNSDESSFSYSRIRIYQQVRFEFQETSEKYITENIFPASAISNFIV